MHFWLAMLTIVLGFVGLLNLTEATFGVGIVGCACLLGILARIAQANEHQKLNVVMLTSIGKILQRLVNR